MVRKMMSVMKWLIILLFGLVSCIAIFHYSMLAKEAREMQPLGQIVTVNGKEMSLYVEGEGEQTLIFLSGAGTPSPILDFKSLFSKLSDRYRIVVVEKFGYGFSDQTNDCRDNATVLAETRQALEKLGIKGPYILVPHSMSGIQALYWAQEYPEEVEGIIGLDMSLPASYEKMESHSVVLQLFNLATRAGMSRLLPASMNDAISDGDLTEAEKELYMKLFHRNLANQTVLREGEQIIENASQVSNFQPTFPILLFISNGEGTGFTKEQWQKIQIDFAEKTEQTKYLILNKPHYLQDHAYEQISREIMHFLSEKE